MLVCASDVSSINNRWSSRVRITFIYLNRLVLAYKTALNFNICKLILPKKKNNVDSCIDPNLCLCITEQYCGVSFVIYFFVFLFVLIENILRCSLLFDAYCKYVFTLYIFINLGAYPCLYDEFLGSDISTSRIDICDFTLFITSTNLLILIATRASSFCLPNE